jgi:hypothetical protein
MLDESFISTFSNSRDMRELLRFLPGIVVQKSLTMLGMADLYRVNMDMLEDYLSDLLRDRGPSQVHHCEPMLHHAYICRQFLSLLDGSNLKAFYLQS